MSSIINQSIVFNQNLFSSVFANLNSICENLMEKCWSLFPPNIDQNSQQDDYSEAEDSKNDPHTYRNSLEMKYLFSQMTIANLVNLMREILFRMETIALLSLFLLIYLVIHFYSRRFTVNNYLESNISNQSSFSFFNLLNRIFWKIFRLLNFTIVFAHLFTVVDSTIKSYFDHPTIINQSHFDLAAVYSMQGRRPNMEDCFSLRNNVSTELGIEYYAIFDGHGGPNAALYADREIFDRISKRIRKVIENSKSEEISIDSCSKKDANLICTSSMQSSKVFENKINVEAHRFKLLTLTMMKNILNEEVINVDKSLVEQFTRSNDISGTTVLIAIRLLHSNKLLVANVGDSRGILCDSKGTTIPLSFDHKPYQSKEYRRIIDAGGYISLKGVYRVNGILAISRALGDYPLKENRLIIPDPDILTFDLNELQPKFMIMATDGFWDTFSNENAVKFVHDELSQMSSSAIIKPTQSLSSIALHVAKRLAKEAFTRESYDNITVIFILFDKDLKKFSTAFAKATPSSSNPTIKTKSTNDCLADKNEMKSIST
ncbi:hypothetical protein SSS_06398 [Sarcoptes scabiei]|nr:hypothetical protein SSS_06398 [Sarcoptes scabiei]